MNPNTNIFSFAFFLVLVVEVACFVVEISLFLKNGFDVDGKTNRRKTNCR